ncbi:MAG: EAL domain-containing protein [Pseudohongiellaceae bacterium]|nr:EAL domain-containing protein [Pseudohongiellaceae bacterium]
MGSILWLIYQAKLSNSPYFLLSVIVGFLSVVCLSTGVLILKQRSSLDEQRFRALTEKTTNITLILNRDGGHRYASPTLKLLLGPDADSVRTLAEYVHPEDIGNISNTIRKAISKGKPEYLHAFRCLRSDGAWRTMEGEFTAMLDTPGVNGIVANIRDVTQQRLVEQSMQTLSSAVEQSSSAVLIADKDGMIQYVNPSYMKITGYQAADLVGERSELLYKPDITDSDNRTLWECVRSGKTWEASISSHRRNGERFWQSVSASPIFDDSRQLSHIVLNIEDVSEQRKTHAKMEKLAFYDPLTGLENRRLFKDRLEQGLKQVKRHKSMMALLFLDLDQFKRINDTLGHDAGDDLLCTVARRIKRCVREVDIVSRLGGDEFTILLPDLRDNRSAAHVADKILKALAKPIQLGTQEVIVSASIGITMAPDDSLNASVLMRNADLAMYRAKDQGRNNFQFFTDDMNIESVARMSLENELRAAVANDDFVVYFQPQVDMETRSVCGFEALVRWRHLEFDMIPPDRFIPVAEETGLILQLGEIVLRKACMQIKQLEATGIANLSVSVNLSARQFRDQNLIELVKSVLDETNLDPQYLELEITESMLMDNIDQAIDILRQLKALGLTVSIDDFGTGYSSLNYLTRLPVDKLKVDRSFVCNLPHDESHMAITTTIIAMAKQLNMQVIAEGVETKDQLHFLMSKQCNVLQGYLFGAPVSSRELIPNLERLQGQLLAPDYDQEQSIFHQA